MWGLDGFIVDAVQALANRQPFAGVDRQYTFPDFA